MRKRNRRLTDEIKEYSKDTKIENIALDEGLNDCYVFDIGNTYISIKIASNI